MSDTDNSERFNINGLRSYQISDNIYHKSAIYVYIMAYINVIHCIGKMILVCNNVFYHFDCKVRCGR